MPKPLPLGAILALCCSCASPVSTAPPRGAVAPETPAEQADLESVAMKTVFDFSDPASEPGWRVVDDGVMGGVSKSQFGIEGGRAIFAGTVSPENNGGFASVRASVPEGLDASARSIVLRVRGDGKRYQLRARTDARSDGPAHKHDFETTPGEWVIVELPLSDFRATFRGRPVPGAPALKAAEIQQLGFLIADRQYGRFRLEIAWIRTP